VKCPKCNTILSCPCIHCRKRDEGNKEKSFWLWIHINPSDAIGCPVCGHESDIDDFEEEQNVKQLSN
jgi:hypothetical protein